MRDSSGLGGVIANVDTLGINRVSALLFKLTAFSVKVGEDGTIL